MTTASGQASSTSGSSFHPESSFLNPNPEKYSYFMAPKTRQRSNAYDMLIRRLLIDPRRSRLIGPLDSITAFALIFTTFVTPYEVALLRSGSEALYWVNRFVDMIFLIDMLLQFILVYQIHGSETGAWQTRPTSIALRYLRTWFPLDAVSNLASLVDIGSNAGWFGSRDDGNADFLNALRLVRLIKLSAYGALEPPSPIFSPLPGTGSASGLLQLPLLALSTLRHHSIAAASAAALC